MLSENQLKYIEQLKTKKRNPKKNIRNLKSRN